MEPHELRKLNHGVFGQLVQLNETEIYPRIIEFAADDRQKAIVTCYLRLYAWSLSLYVLDGTEHFQAISAGTRSMFEILLDLLWFEKFPEPEWVERYHGFFEIDRYNVTRKIRKFKKELNGPQIASDLKEYTDTLNLYGTTKPANAKRLWPTITVTQLKHWTGKNDTRQRARDVGVEEQYVRNYSIHSCDVHAGPTAIVRKGDEQYELSIAVCCFFAFQYLNSGASTACGLLGVKEINDLFSQTEKMEKQMRFR